MRRDHLRPSALLVVPMAGLLALPVVALVLSSSPGALWAGLHHPDVAPALWLSLRTSCVSLAVVILLGLPMGWWLARARGRAVRWVELLVDLPIVLPPAVVGIALLAAFGRGGVFGETFGWSIPFTTTAVVVAQVVVSAPFFVQAAAGAFRRVDMDLMLVARTLGATPIQAFVRVAVPTAGPGLIAGAALAWARALGEFGATLLFAGNLPGVTRTMPLAIYTALESDIEAALALALALAALSVLLLVALRGAPALAKRVLR